MQNLKNFEKYHLPIKSKNHFKFLRQHNIFLLSSSKKRETQ